VSACEQEANSSAVDFDHGQDVRIFVKQPESWIDGSIEMLEEEGFAVDSEDCDVFSTFDIYK